MAGSANVPKSSSEDDIREFLVAHPPYDRMSSDHLRILELRLKPVRFGDGEVIADPDAGPAEWFYILREGRIVGDDSEDNETQSFELLPGECFPIGALIANRPVRGVMRAAGDVVCLTMDRAAFNELRETSSVFSEYCAHRLSGLLEKVNRQVRAEAAQGLGGTGSLDFPLSQTAMRDPIFVAPDASVRSVLELMSAEKIGSMAITDPAGRAIGIFTLKDLMNRVALRDAPYETEIREVMTPDPVSVPFTAFGFEAAMAMADAKVQHLCVVEDGKLVGVISERDLFAMQRIGLVDLSKSISRAGSVPELARIEGDIQTLVNQMVAQGVMAQQITQIISLLNDQIVVRVIELLRGSHPQADGIEFTWLAFGSEGRSEQTLKTDQDNGIIFDAPDDKADEIRAALLPLAADINDALDACGFPLCTGGIMARNPECCLSVSEWRARFSRWIDQGTPEHLLKASIFFDFRAIYGPEESVEDLRDWLLSRSAENSRFRRQMAATSLQNAPPLGLIRGLRLSGEGEEANTVDLKFSGVTPFIDAARILALAHGVAETNTTARLEGAAAKGALDANDVAAWVDAYDYIRMLRMRTNERQQADGRELSNRVNPENLSDLDRRILIEAFREAKRLQRKISLDYQL